MDIEKPFLVRTVGPSYTLLRYAILRRHKEIERLLGDKGAQDTPFVEEKRLMEF